MSPHLLLGAVAIALAAMCGHGDTTPPTTTTMAPESTTPPTIVATTTTTTIVMTTEVPLTIEEAAVAAAAAGAYEVSIGALMDPHNMDEARFDAVYAEGSPFRERLNANLQFLLDSGYAVGENPDNPRQFIVEDVNLLDGPPATRSEVIACVVDTTITYEPGGAPDGSDAIVNDEIFTARARYEVVVEDGQWQLFEAVDLTETLYGVMECPEPVVD